MTRAGAAREHVAAFNAWDTARVLAGFAPDAVWITGTDRFVGSEQLADVFDDWLWSLRPHLEVRALVADEAAAALQLRETLAIEGDQRSFHIAVFLDFTADGLIARGKVYREGSADL